MKVKLLILLVFLTMIVGCSSGPSIDEMQQAIYNNIAHKVKMNTYGVYRLDRINFQKFEILEAKDVSKDGVTYYFRKLHTVSTNEITYDHIPMEMDTKDEIMVFGFVKQGNTWHAQFIK